MVKVKTHVQEVVSSNPDPTVQTINHAPLIWIKSMKAEIVEKVTWHCCMCCNPAKKGRVEFEDGWLIKSSFKTEDEMKACQLTRTKLQKKNIYIYIYYGSFLGSGMQPRICHLSCSRN